MVQVRVVEVEERVGEGCRWLDGRPVLVVCDGGQIDPEEHRRLQETADKHAKVGRSLTGSISGGGDERESVAFCQWSGNGGAEERDGVSGPMVRACVDGQWTS